MDADSYQVQTAKTDLYTQATKDFIDVLDYDQTEWLKLAYCTGKLNGEAGEVAEIVFKAFRGTKGVLDPEQKVAIQKELGDILWYVARMADILDTSLGRIMQMNLDKLSDRQERGKLHGYGDER